MSDLLRPSLQADARTAPVYSARAGFWVAFLGGAVATTLFSALNSHRLGRLSRDAPFYVLGLVAFVAVIGVYYFEPGLLGFDLESKREGRQTLRLLSRGMALALWLGYYLLHRQQHRAMHLTGGTPPSPWKPALACIGLGIPISIALVSAFYLGWGPRPGITY